MASAVSAPSASADGATIYCQLVCFVGEGVVVFGVEAATGNVLWSIDGGSQFELYPYGPAVAVYGSQDVLFMVRRLVVAVVVADVCLVFFFCFGFFPWHLLLPIIVIFPIILKIFLIW